MGGDTSTPPGTTAIRIAAIALVVALACLLVAWLVPASAYTASAIFCLVGLVLVVRALRRRR